MNIEQIALDRFLDNYNKVQRVLLIKSPTIKYETLDIKAHKKSGYMTYPPIEITTLAATLREKLPDIDVKLYDAEYETLVSLYKGKKLENILENSIKEELENFKPDLVGISINFSVAKANGLEILNMVKNYKKNILTVFGGVHSTFDFQDLMDKGADMVFLREADNTFPNFIKYAKNRKLFDAGINGFVYKLDNEIKKIEYVAPPTFEDLPTPAWDMIDLPNYYKVSSLSLVKNEKGASQPSAIIQTLRGCVAKCTFCSVRNFNGIGIRTRKVKDVVDEIELFVNEYEIKFIEVVDDDFTADVPRAIEICKEIIKRKLDITWSLDNGIRLGTITEELAENLVASKCAMISIGIESGNKEILHRIKKPITLPILYKKMKMMAQYPEIYIKANFIVGFPFENYNQLQDTFKVASELDFDWSIFSIYSPLIGTDAMNQYDESTQQKISNNESNFGSIEFVPDGFKSKSDFENSVYLNNLRCNFVNNPNLTGRRNGVERAVKDFERVITTTDKTHAVALYLLSKMSDQIGAEKAKQYKKDYLKILKDSEKWNYFFDELGLKDTPIPEKDFSFKEFRAGREMD